LLGNPDLGGHRERQGHPLRLPTVFDLFRLATNGVKAVQEFEEWRPQLILMDIRMLAMDGHEPIRGSPAL
jgi:CheY-like chemotaxis protein